MESRTAGAIIDAKVRVRDGSRAVEVPHLERADSGHDVRANRFRDEIEVDARDAVDHGALVGLASEVGIPLGTMTPPANPCERLFRVVVSHRSKARSSRRTAAPSRRALRSASHQPSTAPTAGD